MVPAHVAETATQIRGNYLSQMLQALYYQRAPYRFIEKEEKARADPNLSQKQVERCRLARCRYEIAFEKPAVDDDLKWYLKIAKECQKEALRPHLQKKPRKRTSLRTQVSRRRKTASRRGHILQHMRTERFVQRSNPQFPGLFGWQQHVCRES